jgi:hypothetical protein
LHNDPWSNARVPDSGDACDIWDYFRNMAADMAPEVEPYFLTTTARDTALTNWVAAGNTTRDGLRCYVQGVGAMRYLSGAWKAGAQKAAISYASGWATYSGTAYYQPFANLGNDDQVVLRGTTMRTGANVALTTGALVTIGTLPSIVTPTAGAGGICMVGLGSGPDLYPARWYVAAGSTALQVIGIATGVGTFVSNTGFVSLDGISWFLG